MPIPDEGPPGAPLALATIIEAGGWPPQGELNRLATRAAEAVFIELALAPSPATELSILFTGDAASRRLNAEWRGKDRPTNVLSFPAMPVGADGSLPPMLGDIVLAAETIRREAEDEGKPFEHHLAHLLVHGILHLLGHDHEDGAEAESMEATERRVLARLAIPDPYN